jgi:DNA-binding transcriptional regulator YiaG
LTTDNRGDESEAKTEWQREHPADDVSYGDHKDGRSHVNTDKARRAMIRKMRERLKVKQSELAALAGIPQKLLARFERGKHVSLITEDRVTGAITRDGREKES